MGQAGVVVDEIVEKLLHQKGFKLPSLDLDNTTVGMSGNLAIPTSGISSLYPLPRLRSSSLLPPSLVAQRSRPVTVQQATGFGGSKSGGSSNVKQTAKQKKEPAKGEAEDIPVQFISGEGF